MIELDLVERPRTFTPLSRKRSNVHLPIYPALFFKKAKSSSPKELQVSSSFMGDNFICSEISPIKEERRFSKKRRSILDNNDLTLMLKYGKRQRKYVLEDEFDDQKLKENQGTQLSISLISVNVAREAAHEKLPLAP